MSLDISAGIINSCLHDGDDDGDVSIRKNPESDTNDCFAVLESWLRGSNLKARKQTQNRIVRN
jgi:hypothetical protein